MGGDSAAKQETPMQMMRSLGDGHVMENTQQKVHIVFSSLAAPERHCSTQFGRPKPNPNAVFRLAPTTKQDLDSRQFGEKGLATRHAMQAM